MLRAPSEWAENRWSAFLTYGRLLRKSVEQGDTTHSADRNKMREGIIKNHAEPILFRAQAYFLLALIDMNQDDFERAAGRFREGLNLIPKATSEERNRQIKFDMGGFETVITVNDQLEDLVTNLNANLNFLENPDYVEIDGVPKVNGIPDPAIVRRLTIGGAECDCCGKSRTDVAGGNLKMCGRCKMGYYCSSECQTQQWNAGHKSCCRAPGQIKDGDCMITKRSSNRPDLSGKLVRVLGPSRDEKSRRWRFAVLANSDEKGTVGPSALMRIRPEK